MGIIKKLILVVVLGFVMSGCASNSVSSSTSSFKKTAQTAQTAQTPTLASLTEDVIKATQETQAKFDQQQAVERSSNIAFPPAIDISYAEVLGNIDQNIGANVRWGGQVIESVKVDDSTVRLTLFTYPLSTQGRPLITEQTGSQSGRFIVDLRDGFAQGVDFHGSLLTFYGDITSSLVISNGSRQTEIPVINAQEFVDWNVVDQNRSYVGGQPNNSYYRLGSRVGSIGYQPHFYAPYYGRSSFRFGRRHSSIGFSRGLRSFGSRSFSNRRFNNRGFKRFRSRSFRSRGFRRH